MAASIEYVIDPRGRTLRIDLVTFPFILGRDATAHFIVPNSAVSKHHAAIDQVDGRFVIRDLGSCNGTYVNGEQVQEQLLDDGDIIHLCNAEFRFSAGVTTPTAGETPVLTTDSRPVATRSRPSSVLRTRSLVFDLMHNQRLHVKFQPIVDLASGAWTGFEALGRGPGRGATERPADLFRLAESCDLAADLSRAFLRIALREADALPAGLSLFCNLHPDEIESDLPMNIEKLVPSQCTEGRTIVMEVPESAKADAALLRDLSVHLRRRRMQMAFDDFGRGQSRLASLSEAPPDYIKLDRQLVHDIDKNPRRRDVVRAIINAARDLHVTVIAEGLERPEELAVCRDLGCHWGQGFLLGHPESVTSAQESSSVNS